MRYNGIKFSEVTYNQPLKKQGSEKCQKNIAFSWVKIFDKMPFSVINVIHTHVSMWVIGKCIF